MPSLQELILAGLNHAQAGRLAEAEQCYRQVLSVDPNPTTRILLASLLPPVYLSMDELNQWRQKLTNNLQMLVKQGLRLDVMGQYAVPEFFVTYQGMNDRELQQLRARLYDAPREIMLKRSATPSKKPRIRVGFMSAHLRDHTIGRLNHGNIAQLNRDEFDVTVFVMGTPKGELTDHIRDNADAYIELPNDLRQARRLMAGQKLDVLYYCDIGMEPTSYTFALTRMAPVQCVTWGHPETSGIDAIDYFISSEALETAESDASYTEKLVRLKHLNVYFYRPPAPKGPVARTRFGLSDDSTLYGCPQSLYKFHPEFDVILAGILRKDPRGVLVLLKGNHQDWDNRLMRRFQQTMPDLVNRVRWIGRQDRAGFLALNSILDVSLDPVHFGGGNTSYEALAMGTPIVTMPSQFLRGRLTYAMYVQMGVIDCVAKSPQQYIDIATRLGTDKSFRKTVSEKIRDNSAKIFENPAGVRDLEAFFKKAVNEAPSLGAAPITPFAG